MTPTAYYQRLIESDQIIRDEQQAAIIERLQVINDNLLQATKKNGLISKLLNKSTPIQGLYLWGEVGIGKTFLMDVFFYCLPFQHKLRIHFHKFMKMVHEQLATFKGQIKPLEKVAKKLGNEVSVICFDELVVHDIADAMLLAGLFDALYKQNICLLFTSNVAPDELYLNGIQRENFLPAIELIKQNSQVINITTQTDYRFRDYKENNFYYTPLDQQAEKQLTQQFYELSHTEVENVRSIRICDRDIPVRKVTNEVVWFDFLNICGIPRSQDDYLAIANKYQAILISNVVAIQPEQNDLARSFINLVDVFYDANKKLIISAEKPIEQIYMSGRMLFEFARTRSRLIEMQTLAWQKKCDNYAKLRLDP